MSEFHTGGCLCQAVRYEFSTEPLMAVHCYCRDCQKATGSAFATVFGISQAAFRLLQGEPGEFTVTANSGRAVTRQFCKVCGSPLFTKAEMALGLIFTRPAAWMIPVGSPQASTAGPPGRNRGPRSPLNSRAVLGIPYCRVQSDASSSNRSILFSLVHHHRLHLPLFPVHTDRFAARVFVVVTQKMQ